MKYKSIIVILSILVSNIVAAQRVVSTTNKKAIKQFESGIEAMRSGNLEKAKSILESAIETDDKIVEARIVMGDILSKQQDNLGAIVYYKEAIELAPDFYSLAYFKIAKLSFLEQNFEQANDYIKLFLGRKSVDPKYRGFSEKILRDSEFAKVAVNKPVDYLLATVPGGINSKYDEYFPTLTADDSTMLYTRMLPVKPGSKAFQEDFFYSNRGAEEWGNSLQLTPDINTPLNEGAPSLSADGRSLIFTVCGYAGGSDYGDNREGYGSCDLFFAVKQGNTWSKAFNLGQGINTNGWESQPSLASDGKTLYFVRGQHGKSATINIYTSTLDSRGNWSKAAPIKGKVNTKFRESSVFIHPDNQTLYFTSDGHPGMGGDDIFYSRKLPDGTWGEPTNLGYPINTIGNENSLLVSASGDLAYYASNKEGGKGGLDIYSFQLPSEAKPRALSYAKGVVKDAETLKPLFTLLKLIDVDSKQVVVQAASDGKSGEFLVTLPAGKEYALNIKKDGYLFYSENFKLTGSESVLEPYAIEALLKPIKVGSTVTLKNVFFATASFELESKSEVELDKLVDFLTENANLVIEISGHTDDVGDDESNRLLSDNRAKAVKEYLIAKGISAARLEHKGYGETMPVEGNDTVEGRALNRRTEFKILK
jgi:outer membrane protein OmpA-like peptidoglycan-associated protein/tetratricopeptide (TPR) repeat protein